MVQRKSFRSIFHCCSILVFSLMAAQTNAAQNTGKAISEKPSELFEMTKKTKLNDIRSLPDQTMVRTSSGRMVRAANFKALADAIKSARSASGTSKVRNISFSKTQSAPQLQIVNGTNLNAIKNRNSSDVMQLPNGLKMTVADFKKLDEIAKIQTGKSLTERQPSVPSTSGPTIKIKSAKDVQALASKPDSTVLEGPLGKRITLGELRAYAQKNNKPLGVR